MDEPGELSKWLYRDGITIKIAIGIIIRPHRRTSYMRPVLQTWSVGRIITGSTARSARRRYLIYSEADFEVFRPAGATRCTDGVKFGTDFTPIGATTRLYGPQQEGQHPLTGQRAPPISGGTYRRRRTLIDGYLESPFPTACLL